MRCLPTAPLTYYCSRPSDGGDTPAWNSTAEPPHLRAALGHREFAAASIFSSSLLHPAGRSRRRLGRTGGGQLESEAAREALQGSREALNAAAAAAELQGASIRRHLLPPAGLSTFGSHVRVSEHASSLSECAPVHVGAHFGRGDWGAAGQRG